MRNVLKLGPDPVSSQLPSKHDDGGATTQIWATFELSSGLFPLTCICRNMGNNGTEGVGSDSSTLYCCSPPFPQRRQKPLWTTPLRRPPAGEATVFDASAVDPGSSGVRVTPPRAEQVHFTASFFTGNYSPFEASCCTHYSNDSPFWWMPRDHKWYLMVDATDTKKENKHVF